MADYKRANLIRKIKATKQYNMKRLISILTTAAIIAGGAATFQTSAKKVLSHEDFDAWKRARNYSLSNDGNWSAFAVVPQEGDATLTLYNTSTRKRIDIPRGYNPTFSADSRYAVALIKPLFAETRKAKIDGKKGLDLPQDTLIIVDLKTGDREKIPQVTGYTMGENGGSYVAYRTVDTLYVKPKLVKEKGVGQPMVLRKLGGPQQKIVKWVDKYVFSKDGKKLALTIKKSDKDSIATNGLGVVMLPDTSFTLLSRELPFYGAPVFNEAGTALAFVASADSTETGTRKANIYYTDLTAGTPDAQDFTIPYFTGTPQNLALAHSSDPETQKQLEAERGNAIREALGEELFINQYSKPVFSHNGKRLIVGVAPYVAPNDTNIVDFETATLDIWRWDAPFTPPREKSLLSEIRENTYPVVIDLASGHQQLLTSNPLAEVEDGDRWDGTYALVTDPTETMISRQWDYTAAVKLASVDVNNGQSFPIGEAPVGSYQVSPCGNYVIWFDNEQYYCYSNLTHTTAEISKNVPQLLWDETDDHPMPSDPFGIAAWSKDDSRVLVYDRYDIWELDPAGKAEPVCLTKGEGRKSGYKYRYFNTDPDRRYLTRGDKMVISVFDTASKEHGLATMTYGAPAVPSVSIMDKATFSQFRKAKNADVYSWQKASFELAPNIWECRGTNFAKAVKVSDSNPQQSEYSWGTAHLEKWRTYDGRMAEGVLYLPEDFDSSKEYPMLTVFYELAADDLYTHYTMEPSWSWVNYPFYVSRGYVVFVPDIRYTPGIPGEGAYNYVCSGVEAMCKKYPNIDKNRLGIDGQSWGGYQTAYLVTRTNMFACAGSGAPVSNMTSAFGGIRWGSGDSRQAQYEMGQSRIGFTLWEAPELYIYNSPLFHAENIQTPLLIMHNDEDGAVPWYQGIELFMAMRRLGKPVWMLQYNGEAHNLKERRNRKDITHRLQGFFDHYLMGAPMPKWMKEGIPAIRKGQEMNY